MREGSTLGLQHISEMSKGSTLGPFCTSEGFAVPAER